MPIEVNVTIKLQPDRRRLASMLLKGLHAALASDAKQYARGTGFLPIFPTDDPTVSDAVATLINHLDVTLQGRTLVLS